MQPRPHPVRDEIGQTGLMQGQTFGLARHEERHIISVNAFDKPTA